MCSSAVHCSTPKNFSSSIIIVKAVDWNLKKVCTCSNPIHKKILNLCCCFFFHTTCIHLYNYTYTCMCTHVQTSVPVVLLAVSVDSLMYHLHVANTTKVIHKNKKCTVHAITCICHSKQELLQAKITGY